MRNIGFLVIGLFWVGCSTDDPNINVKPNPLEGLPDKGPIRFDHPAIGQRSYYVFLKAVQDLPTKQVSFEYRPDTLVWVITDKELENWTLKEFLTEGSYSKVTSSDGYWINLADSVFVRYLRVSTDSIHFSGPPNVDIFSFVFHSLRGKVSFPVLLGTDPTQLNPNCSPFKSSGGEWMEYTINYTQLGKTFDHLNDYFDHRDVEVDGNGYMYAYSASNGIVRMSWINPWIPYEAYGWDLAK